MNYAVSENNTLQSTSVSYEGSGNKLRTSVRYGGSGNDLSTSVSYGGNNTLT